MRNARSVAPTPFIHQIPRPKVPHRDRKPCPWAHCCFSWLSNDPLKKERQMLFQTVVSPEQWWPPQIHRYPEPIATKWVTGRTRTGRGTQTPSPPLPAGPFYLPIVCGPGSIRPAHITWYHWGLFPGGLSGWGSSDSQEDTHTHTRTRTRTHAHTRTH